ncbi:ubiquitin carboxyl-terminal hydrolase 32 [Epargyreus clarus]|uniref:ubiquitin carboxyl-terminal hydrolase 32 n=1 Tax=Epargyreus clarus TaxID=520877 RepID=UPI003C2CF961
MGAKDSKPSFISYDDAAKRVSDSELRRIREAFKRCAGANGTTLSLEAFVHEVLCDGVPYEVAEWLYQACGGTKRGITFKDLLCGVVVLTKGNIEEKIKFLWTLYVNNQSENGSYIYKRDFARALHIENTSLPASEAHRSIEVLTSLFGSNEKVTFEQFRSWLLIHKDATVLSKWLLYDRVNVTQDLETPTFYQSLAGVTHLEERDIIELEKCFWSLRNAAPTGQLDAESLAPLLSPPLPRAAVAGCFLAFDENRDGHVDFKELCCGLSAACRGPRTERLKFCFKIFDLDRDGILNKKELIDMVGILCTVANEALKNQGSRSSTPSDGESEGEKGFDPEVVLLNIREKLVMVPKNGRKPRFQLGPSNGEDIIILSEMSPMDPDSASSSPEPPEPREPSPPAAGCEQGLISCGTALTAEDFLIWSVESAEALLAPFLQLVFEVCHVVLGLRPQCPHQEMDVVLGWLSRETARGLHVGQFWYLVGAEWWAAWRAHCAAPRACCRAPPARKPHEHEHNDVTDATDAPLCDDSFTTNSTESMGSLLWRAEGESADSASLGSAGGSSGLGSLARPPHPGPVDNRRLLAHDHLQVRTLTGEGGHLRRDVTLAQHRDFQLLPDALWRALALWYGGPDPLPRQVIRPPNSDVELELYPLQLKILRHVPSTQRPSAVAAPYGAVSAPAPPERQLAYTAAFSRLATIKQVTEFLCQALGLAREDVRLWSLANSGSALLLDDERPTLQALRLDDRARLLLEVRNPDLTWPEEIGALSSSGAGRVAARRDTLTAPDLPGATGLHNLGNTCFMNAALQCVWNTGPLTMYFNSGMHLYEVNTSNPLGTRGALALRYGELCKEVWSGSARSVAPLRVRWCVSRHARLAGGQQHDAQELLAWLLDALHEDLNRAAPPPPAPDTPAAALATPAADAPAADGDEDNRPDEEVAAAAWAQYQARNASVMTELFYGQLRSAVRCAACARRSVRFDTFNMLSLPLPMECELRAEARVMLLDGSVPIKYGVKINADGTYLDVKKKLSELCGLSPDSMLLVLLSGATIGSILEDHARVSAATASDLYAYEIPAPEPDDIAEDVLENGGWSYAEGSPGAAAAGAAEVSVGARAGARSLCMPALFCFKRSRSEILMSQSPPDTFYTNRATAVQTGGAASAVQTGGTVRPGLARAHSASPPPPRPASPRLAKVKFSSSPSEMYRMDDVHAKPQKGNIQYLIAVHRKQVRWEAYFLPWQRWRALSFGAPLVVRARAGASGRELYARVWAQLARLLARPPPRAAARPNHATDCDDSLGYEFPFTLRAVSATGGAAGAGAWCALCAWPALCRGCALPSDDAPLILPSHGESTVNRKQSMAEGALGAGVPDGNSPIARAKLNRHNSARLSTDIGGESLSGTVRRLELGMVRRGEVMLAIDWDPTALHLQYQSAREKAWIEHPSVSATASGPRAVDLRSCLRAFTSEERLEERYHCAHCRRAQPATKKLQIWRAPPVLIIHLKRFQYVNNKWIKSQKVVNFPFEDFDPTPFLAAVPQETILRHFELKTGIRPSLDSDVEDRLSSDSESECEDSEGSEPSERPRRPKESRGRERLQSTSLLNSSIKDDNLVDYHQHHLKEGEDPFDLKYRLYAVVSHSGQLSGGHYVAYARHPSGAWLCYNDSMCRELPRAPRLDAAAAYLLFYERRGLRAERYLPDVAGRAPPAAPPPSDADDRDKPCSLM